MTEPAKINISINKEDWQKLLFMKGQTGKDFADIIHNLLSSVKQHRGPG